MATDPHHAGWVRPPRRSRIEKPIATLWTMTKAGHTRTAHLHAHELGFELRIVDGAGEIVFTQVQASEPACVQLAAARQDAYTAKGWQTPA